MVISIRQQSTQEGFAVTNQNQLIRNWEYLAGGTIVVNDGERTILVHPNMPRWIIEGHMKRSGNRGCGPDKAFVLSVTDRCNIHCDFCCHPYQKTEFSTDDAVRLVEEACSLPFDEICVTGGEPYLRRPLVYRLATICRKNGRLFGSITNGFWAKNRDVAFRLAHEMVDNGVARVTFSWDPSHGEFVKPQTVQNGVDACMDAGMRVCLAGSFRVKDDVHLNYGIDISEYRQYKNFNVVESYIAPAGWAKSLVGLYRAPVTPSDAARFRCPGSMAQELVLYAQDGLSQPCCSVHAGYDMPSLRIGDWRTQPVQDLLNAQMGDGFYRVVVDGGFSLLYDVIRDYAPDVYRRLPTPEDSFSSCHLCERIMASADAKQIRKVCDEYLLSRSVAWVRQHPEMAEKVLNGVSASC
jgi:hypothetical protein